MKGYRRLEVYFRVLLILELNVESGQLHAPADLSPGSSPLF